MENQDYPVTATAIADERLSRLLIFVKIFAVIPHIFVLYFLHIAFSVLTFIAWFAILFTGKYPEGMFNFNVGVMRWQWRTTLYVCLITDRYPPFTLDADPNFPGNFDVERAPHYSRLLIFVKFLLAFPHFIVLALLSFVLCFVLLLAWFAILFLSRIPDGLAKFIIGFLRWQYRVNSYVILLTDAYPPFSFE